MENREKRTLKKVNMALESIHITDVKNALLDLLELYNKQSKRTDRILHTSDKLQESLLILNERLMKINEVQEHNIGTMLQDQKQRARNILNSKKTLYESHKKEVYNYQISINALRDLLAEKDDIYSKYMALKKDYQEAQKAKKQIKTEPINENYSELELENALDKLKENNLEKELLALTKRIVEEDINVGFADNIQYSKRFLKTFKTELENGFLSSNQCGVQKEKIALFIIRRYLEDMLSIVADIIIQKSVEKVKTAVNFLSSFSGKVVFDSNGAAINKLEIIDNNGNKWVPAAISQVYVQRSSTLKQIQAKKDLIRHINIKIDSFQNEIVRLGDEIEKIMPQENKLDKIEKAVELTTEEEMKIKFLRQLIAKSVQDANAQRQITASENGKLVALEAQLHSLNEKCDSIIAAFVKVLM